MSELTYEQRFTALLETEQSEKKQAVLELETARAAYKGMKATCKGMKDEALSESTLREAERTYADAVSAAEERARQAYTDLRKELEDKVRFDSLVNPDDVDANALALLKSDILKPDDLAALALRYAKNPTMLRLIANHAKKCLYAASGASRDDERNALADVVEACRKRLTAELDAFDRFTTEYANEHKN